jgi:hypothetical protein
MFCKIAPHSSFEHPLKAFNNTGFGFGITGGEEMNGLESLSQFLVGKFFALIRLYAYGTSSVFKDLLEYSVEWVPPRHIWITRR